MSAPGSTFSDSATPNPSDPVAELVSTLAGQVFGFYYEPTNTFYTCSSEAERNELRELLKELQEPQEQEEQPPESPAVGVQNTAGEESSDDNKPSDSA